MTTLELIDKAILERSSQEKRRTYMGASILGEECDRKLYYSYKKPFTVKDARIQRIFDMGNIIEDYLIKLLKDAGFTVYDVDKDGKQFGFEDGEIAGHSDGVIVGVPELDSPALLEFKSAKNSRFNEFKKNDVRTVSNNYFVQTQVYMQKLKLNYCLFIVMNKDTQELYMEIINYDKEIADIYITRGKDIARSTELPSRAYAKKTFFKCRFCDYSEECWEND